MKELISIITATYNAEDWILKTYESIKIQTYSDWEWIVTDDCSTDATFIILSKIAENDERVKVFSNNYNCGAAVSRNKSIDNSMGNFFAFIDSDDLWLPNKLYSQLIFMKDNDINFSFTAYELINKCDKQLGLIVDSHHSEPINYEDMLRKKATLGCSTVMLRRNVFEDLSMPLLRTGQDYATWLKLLKTGNNAVPLTEVLTQYRILPNSISRNKFKKAKRQWQIYRELEKLSFIKSVICFSYYAWRAVFRK